MKRLRTMPRWQQRCKEIRVLRQAYDNADVDGNNELDEDELEIVLVSMDPAHVSTEDVDYLWAVRRRAEYPMSTP